MCEIQSAAEILPVSVDHGHLRGTCGQSVKAIHAIYTWGLFVVSEILYQHQDTKNSQYPAVPTADPLLVFPVCEYLGHAVVGLSHALESLVLPP